MGRELFFSRLVLVLGLICILGCARALPTKDEQTGINQALLKAEVQARLAKQFSEDATTQKAEAKRALEQAKVFYEDALKVQELCRKRAKPIKCPILKDCGLNEVKKEEHPKQVETPVEILPERRAESAVTRKVEGPVEPTLDTTDLDYSPSDAPPGLYEKLNKAGK